MYGVAPVLDLAANLDAFLSSVTFFSMDPFVPEGHSEIYMKIRGSVTVGLGWCDQPWHEGPHCRQVNCTPDPQKMANKCAFLRTCKCHTSVPSSYCRLPFNFVLGHESESVTRVLSVEKHIQFHKLG